MRADQIRINGISFEVTTIAPKIINLRNSFVTATVNAGDFADQLEKAVERSRMIGAKPNGSSDTAIDPSNTQRQHVQASINGKPTIPDRRYRKW